MSRKLLSLSAMATLMGGTALADVPSVAVDIAPIHSLVARVMGDVGTPDLIVQQGASPHQYSLRPSEAAALQEANLVFWMGADLSPWLEDAIATLSDDAVVTTLLEADATVLIESREGALFERHGHGDDDHEEHDEHADEHDHEVHDHEEHADEHADEHDHEEHDHEEHEHGAHDPHAWLSIENADAWLNLIAAQLSAADPDNAGSYFANAAAARAEMERLAAEINATLDPARGGSFIVFHDAYQYFEVDFDFPASGSISLSDASDPSPARIADIQGRIQAEGVDCVLAEPQFNPGIVEVVLDGTDANTGVIDPLGSELAPGPDLYPQLMRNMATTLLDCL
ncbi:zinc ABC transporter substrate-binding protein [Rhodobacteraceae bacterium N5(2021)]|uniref:High-affinity zinc uptake system protein ZnuA n=1 Tax=Gymnodinialimonas phycosphaerae TaxID=2841589 RepID=A0A975TWF6_9RHOB|nr:zinc ABC transporter substrate-binding protein [Gymnodinialimonas phycosphaerae]MBY4891925.1 zinc ABC transporter substrate-binding protein [Gymnodinialimonas phycosphaerae]